MRTFLFFVFVFTFFSFSLFAQGDDCNTALEITNVENFCSNPGAYNNTGATPSSYNGASCWSGAKGNDVWFKFTTKATAVSISIIGNDNGSGTLNQPMIALYDGSCSGTITELGCKPSNLLKNIVSINRGGLNIGQTYFIRVSGGNNNTGTFKLCLNNFTPIKAPGQDCATNTYLCNKNPINLDSPIGAGNDTKEAAGTCFNDGLSYTEANSMWFTWVAANNGTLTFTLSPSSASSDVDFVLFELTGGSCANKNVLRCSAAGQQLACWGPTGLDMTSTDVAEKPGCDAPNDKFVKYINMVAGTTYGLMVEGFDNDGSVNLTFGGTGEFLGPKPDFTLPSTVCAGSTITVTDKSTNATGYKWDFGKDATPATDTTVGPHTVKYTSVGPKTVMLTVKGKGGCEVIATKTFTVVPCEPFVSVNSTSVCAGVCATLTANAVGGNPPYTYVWNNGLATSSIQVCPTTNTQYTVTITDALQMKATATATVNITAPPKANAGADATICFGSDYTLTASGGTSYVWSTGASTATITVNPTNASTTYTVVAAIGNCTDQDDVTIFVNPEIKLATSHTDPLCFQDANGSASVNVLNGNLTYTYLWNTGPPQTNAMATGLKAGTYQVIVSDNLGCSAKASVILSDPSPITLTLAADTAACFGDTITLVSTIAGGTPAYQYSWSHGLSNAAIHTVIPPSTTTYSLLVTDSKGCSTGSQIKITIYPIPTPSFIQADTGCVPLAVTFTNTSTDADSYEWIFGDGTHATETHPHHTYLTDGLFTVSLIAKNKAGCSDTLTQKDYILVYPIPELNLYTGSETVSELNPDVLFITNAKNTTDCIFTFGDGDTLFTCDVNESHHFDTVGVYCAKFSSNNAYGCASSITKCIEVKPEWTFYIPNSFTPNDDAHNNIFYAYATNIKEFDMRIFDRWGNEIFRSESLNQGWNGRLKTNEKATEDVYVYKVIISDNWGKVHQYIGAVTLIR